MRIEMSTLKNQNIAFYYGQYVMTFGRTAGLRARLTVLTHSSVVLRRWKSRRAVDIPSRPGKLVSELKFMTEHTVERSETDRRLFQARRLRAALLLCSCAAMIQTSCAQGDTYARAESLVRNRQWDEGLSALAPVLKSEPGNLKALNLAGLAFIGKGDTHRAERYFKEALALNPKFAPALKNLSISEFNAQNYAAAQEHLQAAERITPADPAIHLYLGEDFYQQKSYQRAADELARVDASATCRQRISSERKRSSLRFSQKDLPR
jgi:tetratricopeptide (TPR) repeat protein